MLATNRRGFTLLESLVSMLIVSMTVVGAFTVVRQQLQMVGRAREALDAEALAAVRLDYMGLLNDQELRTLPDTMEKGTFDYPLDGYSWEATSEPNEEFAGLYNVTLKINWETSAYIVHTNFYRRPTVRTVN